MHGSQDVDTNIQKLSLIYSHAWNTKIHKISCQDIIYVKTSIVTFIIRTANTELSVKSARLYDSLDPLTGGSPVKSTVATLQHQLLSLQKPWLEFFGCRKRQNERDTRQKKAVSAFHAGPIQFCSTPTHPGRFPRAHLKNPIPPELQGD